MCALAYLFVKCVTVRVRAGMRVCVFVRAFLCTLASDEDNHTLALCGVPVDGSDAESKDNAELAVQDIEETDDAS